MLSVSLRFTFDGQSRRAHSGESDFGPVLSRTFISRSGVS